MVAPVEWLPLDNPRARILKNLDLPAPTPDYIIDEVSVAEVESSLRELLHLYPPRTFTWRETGQTSEAPAHQGT